MSSISDLVRKANVQIVQEEMPGVAEALKELHAASATQKAKSDIVRGLARRYGRSSPITTAAVSDYWDWLQAGGS